MRFNVGSPVWVSNPDAGDQENLWIESTVEGKVDRDPEFEVKVKVRGKDVTFKGKASKIEGSVRHRYPFINITEEDLLNIPELNEPEILSFLYRRFEKGLITTYAGSILLAMNPFEEVKPHASSARLIQEFSSAILRETLDPKYGKTKAILVSGESGSGKTEISKMVMKAFGTRKQVAATAGSSTFTAADLLVSKIMLANKVLESFGNARTATTANSSRFGKLVHLFFSKDGELAGCTINTYLLETSRIVTQQQGERNYNIFYQLVAHNKEEDRAAWRLLSSNDFLLTNQGGTQKANMILQDTKQFQEFLRSMDALGFEEQALRKLCEALAGVLYLGQIAFDEYTDKDKLQDEKAHSEKLKQMIAFMQTSADLLGVSRSDLESLLLKKVILVHNEKYVIQLDRKQAIISRDALVKLVYKCAFDWVVQEMNAMLQPRDSDDCARRIMLLDMFGFDSFQKNSIDQLCINYVNEALQEQFNEHVFRMEVKLYEEEGIKYEKIKFSDNQDNVDLIKGIFRILDDQCRLPKPTDARFAAQVYKEFGNNRLFSASNAQQRAGQFSISHFAGDVVYTADDFIVKNIDNAPATANKTLFESSNATVRAIFAPLNDALRDSVASKTSAAPARASELRGVGAKRSVFDGKKGGAGTGEGDVTVAPALARPARQERTSLVVQIKTELSMLMRQIEQAAPHYIRCVKPFELQAADDAAAAPAQSKQLSQHMSTLKLANANSAAVVPSQSIRFNQYKVAQQLHYGGVFEAVRIARSGFRARFSFYEFFMRYRMVTKRLGGSGESDKDEKSEEDELAVHADTPVEVAERACRALVKALSAMPASASASLDHAEPLLSRQSESRAATTALGLIDGHNLEFGRTRVFLRKREYDVLETRRNQSLSSCIVRIQAVIRLFCKFRRYQLQRKNVVHAQRVVRGHLARRYVKMLRILLVSVVTLQRRFRKRRFARRIVKMQAVWRRHRARKLVKIMQERRAKLVAAYGVLMAGRELRMRRRLQQKMFPHRRTRELVVPAPEIRCEERAHEEKALARAVERIMLSGDAAQQKQQEQREFYTMDELCEMFKGTLVLLGKQSLRDKVARVAALLAPAEHLLTADLVELSLAERLFSSPPPKDQNNGRARARERVVIVNSAAAEKVRLHVEHEIFREIHFRVAKLAKLAVSLAKEAHALQRKIDDSLAETPALEEEKNGLHGAIVDEMNMVYYEPAVRERIYRRNDLRRVAWLRVLGECLRKYYESFVSRFVSSYGDKSSFCRHYALRTRYVKALFEKIYEFRNSEGDTLWKVEVARPREGAAQGALPAQWDDERDAQRQRALVKRFAQAVEDAQRQQSEILSKLALVDLRREELRASGGLRAVLRGGVGFQYEPRRVGESGALSALSELLHGTFLGARHVFRVSEKESERKRGALYQASCGSSYSSFADVLYSPVAVEQVEARSFSAALLACVALGALDLRPHHVLVEYVAPAVSTAATTSATTALLNCIRITAFSLDESENHNGESGKSFSKHDNTLLSESHSARVHAERLNVLFFLPQMDEPVDPDVRAMLTAHAFVSEELVSHWLRELHEINESHAAAARRLALCDEERARLAAPVTLARGKTQALLRRLRVLCALLSEREEGEEDEESEAADEEKENGASRHSGVYRRPASSSSLRLQSLHNHHQLRPLSGRGMWNGGGAASPRLRTVLHADLLRALQPALHEYYSSARRGAEFKEGIDGVAGVVSFAHVYHERLEDELRAAWAHRLRLRIVQQAAKAAAAMRRSELSFDEHDCCYAAAAADDEFDAANPAVRADATRVRLSLDAVAVAAKPPPLPPKRRAAQRERQPGSRPCSQSLSVSHTLPSHETKDALEARERDAELCAIYGPRDESESDAVVLSPLDALRTRRKALQLLHDNDNDDEKEDDERGVNPLSPRPSRSRPSSFAASSLHTDCDDDNDVLRVAPLPRELRDKSRGILRKQNFVAPELAMLSPRNCLPMSPRGQRRVSLRAVPREQVESNIATMLKAQQARNKAHVQRIQDAQRAGREFRKPAPAAPKSTGEDVDFGDVYRCEDDENENETDVDNAQSSDASRSPSDSLSVSVSLYVTVSVEEEAFEFLRRVDLALVSRRMARGDALRFCASLGKNLSFLSRMELLNPSERQLQWLFSHWIRDESEREKERESENAAKLPLRLTELWLRFDSERESHDAVFDAAQSRTLFQLHKRLKVAVKLLFVCENEKEKDAKATKSKSVLRKTTWTPSLCGVGGAVSKQAHSAFVYAPRRGHTVVSLSRYEDEDDEESEYEAQSVSKEETEMQRELFTCLNLVGSADFAAAKHKLDLVQRVIRRVCESPMSTECVLPHATTAAFVEVLLQYPALARIAERLAHRQVFVREDTLVHALLAHPLVERFANLLVALIAVQPHLLWTRDAVTGRSPCDAVKLLPESKPFKYKLLCKFVNFAGFQSFRESSDAIFSVFSGEEELIVRAAQHGVLATERELRTQTFDLEKKCAQPFVPSRSAPPGQCTLPTPGAAQSKDEALVWRLVVEEINGTERVKERCWETYCLLVRTLQDRDVSKTAGAAQRRLMTPQEIESALWKSLDLENKSAEKCIVYHVNEQSLERSRVYVDLRTKWSLGAERVHAHVSEASRRRFGTQLRAMNSTHFRQSMKSLADTASARVSVPRNAQDSWSPEDAADPRNSLALSAASSHLSFSLAGSSRRVSLAVDSHTNNNRANVTTLSVLPRGSLVRRARNSAQFGIDKQYPVF